MEHPNFTDAGTNPGIEIWTIDKFEPVAIESNLYGKFYNGDSYIVLKTTGEEETPLSYDAHFWLGSKTTQDKMGSAAILTVTLDDMLGGKAVHHREVQGHESSLFLGYFKPAIRYLEGGNESGFTEVETNAGADKRLLKLSGCDNMRIEEVPADSSSLTKDNCYILENEHDIFVLMPEGAKATHRRKIISVANTLRDDYHNGRATIEIIDEFSSNDDYVLFFETLGSGSRDDLSNEDSTETYVRSDMSAVYLYRVVLGEDIDVISLSKPYKQRQLSSDVVYILDTPCSGVYIWVGSGVDPDTKKNYNDIAQKYLEVKGYPNWVQVTRVAEGVESSTFKQFFQEWETTGTSVRSLVSESDAGYFSSDAEEAEIAAKLIGKSANARGYMPDQGDGCLLVTRFAGDQEDVSEKFQSELAVLYHSDTYVFKYQYTADSGLEAYVIYWWIGAESSADDRVAAYEWVQELEGDLDHVTVVKLPQGKETKHFLSIFKGNLAVVYGNKDNDYKPENSKGTYDDDGTRLFRVEGTEEGVDMRAIQLPESADVLEDDDVFVLETSGGVYVWKGRESSDEELYSAMSFVSRLVGEKEITVIHQGEETDDFWEALGGQPEEKENPSAWRLTVSRRVVTPATLTAVTVSVTGKIKFEDFDVTFSQQELSDDGVYILDAGEELYLWQGTNIPERVKSARGNIIQEYIEDDGLDRTVESAIAVAVKQGMEPNIFKKLFPSWEDDMWANVPSYEDMKNDAIAANSK